MLIGSYIPWLVVLSVVMATVVSYTALILVARVAHAPASTARVWLVGGAIVMGIGLWSTQFIGILAFTLPIVLRYDVATTLASLFVAVLSCGFALAIASRPDLRLARLASGAFVLGTGFCAMHYLGTTAINVSPAIDYDLTLVTGSAAIAIAAAFAVLWFTFHLRRGLGWRTTLTRIGAALVIGGVVCVMHYTGMAAAGFSASSVCRSGILLDQRWIGGLLAITVLGLLSFTLLLALFDAHISSHAHMHSKRLEQVNAALEHQATHDALTGLPNRPQFMDRMTQTIEAAERHEQSFALVVLDLDRFRIINDSLGYGAGDRLLAEVAKRLTRAVRRVDTVARVDGDEFLIIVGDTTDHASVAAVADEIVAAFAAPFSIQAVDLHVTPSIGISVFPNDGTHVEPLLAHADEAMHIAKRRGGNTYQFFGPGMSRQTEQRLDLENELRRAIEAQQFVLYYQPKVDTASGRINSVEALIRWQHPTRGIVGPGEFIAVAEETGLIAKIGTWVLHEACRQARAWQLAGMPFMRIAVNVSAVQFRQRNLVEVVRQALTSNGLAANYLELELTESSVMTSAEASADILEELSRMGVLVSIDDFGTGYSSMSYLRRFPLDKLKIDRSFVMDVATREEARSIVRAIISLAHGLRLKTVAEGVETEEQRAELERLGCDQYQGYLCSKPLPVGELETLIRARAAATPWSDDEASRTHSRLDIYAAGIAARG